MNRAAWVHQWNQTPWRAAEAVAQSLLPIGVKDVYIKACDGGYWMGAVYSHPLVPTSAASMAQLHADFAHAGLRLVPWVDPRFHAGEAELHAQAGVACGGRLIVDFEYHYDGFWAGSFGEWIAYKNALLAKGLEWVAVAPDPRQVGREYGPSTIAGFAAYLPQCYWTDFRQPAIQVVDSAYHKLEGLGPIEPIFPSDGSIGDAKAAVQYAANAGSAAVSLWRWPPLSSLDGFLAAPDVPEPEQPAAPSNDIPQTYLDRGWDTWFAVYVNLEGIIDGLIKQRDALAAQLAAAHGTGPSAAPGPEPT